MYVWSPLPRSLAAALRDGAHPKPRVRLSAIADLVRWAGSDEREVALARLVELAARDTDLEVRAAAVLGLADAEAVSELPVLLDAARTGPPRVRQMALVSIGELAVRGDTEAAAVVHAALESDAPALRFQGLVAAGRLLSDDELSGWLDRALADGESKLRYIACRIIEERFFSNPDVDAAVRDRLEQQLVPLLSDRESDVAVAAAVLLAPRGSQAARDLLVERLNRRRSFTELEDEQAAIDLCAELRLEAARPGLVQRAFGGTFGAASPLAFQARVALARLGDERAVQFILRGLSSWSRRVRAQNVAAAGLARLEAARPRLLEMRRDASEVDRHSVVEALLALDR